MIIDCRGELPHFAHSELLHVRAKRRKVKHLPPLVKILSRKHLNALMAQRNNFRVLKPRFMQLDPPADRQIKCAEFVKGELLRGAVLVGG